MLVKTFILLTVAVFGSSTDEMPVYDTIIVGMGAAGCTAASVLCKAGKRVLALEAQNRVGGRVNTVPFGSGVVELGAEWIHGNINSRVYDLAIQNNVTILSQDVSFQVYRSDGTMPDKEMINDLINYALESVEEPPEEPQPLGQYLTKRLMEYMASKYPFLIEDQDFIDQFLHFMDLVVNNYEASNSWNDVTTHSKYMDLGGDLHLSWHKNGYKTLFEILLNTYRNGPGYPNLNLQLEKEVTQIRYPEDPAQDVEVTCKDGSTYKGRNVIVTVSLGVLKERYQTLFLPQLPSPKVESIDHITIGVVGKIILDFEQIWWDTSSGLYGFLWSNDAANEISYEDRWIRRIEGVELKMGSNTSLCLWTAGDATKLIETLPEDVIKSKSMELIRRFMGKNKTIPEPIDMLRSTWYSNPFTRGSYTYDNLQTPLYPNARAILAEPLVDSSGAPRVLFAGEATDTHHFSTVHGATDTGHREASRLLPKGKL